ncbi:MAG TPA: ABC transporter permease [Bryobacteraceae bacterium]|nr:ABC transporter permease [Bryobacteraceae bacterium]
MAWYHRFWNAIRPARLNRDLQRELAFHLRERIDELEETGLDPAEAARLAQLQFGSFTLQKERTRDMDINLYLETALRNLKYSARSLAKTPGFTATVVLTLALGIGANSAVFSAIYAILLRPLPFPNGDRLVKLGQLQTKAQQPQIAPVRLEDWNRLNGTLEGITGYYTEDTSETTGDLPEKIKRAWVAPRFLQVMGISPAIGRDFSPAEEHFGGPNAILISDRLWRRRFAARPSAIGKTLRLPRTAFTVIGVMPASFRFPDGDVDVWAVSAPDASYAQSRQLTWFSGIGRLKPAVTLSEARANLAAVQASLGKQFPKPDAEIAVAVDPLKETTVHGVRKSLWILFGAVSLLLLIACTNIVALLLSRAAARRQETSVRFSLGASRASVAAQMFTEVLVLALLGGTFGLGIAATASRVFRVLAKDLPRIEEVGLNWTILFYSLVTAVAVTLICGVLPAIRGTRRDLAASLSHGSRTQVAGHNRVQFTLVGVQVALAVTLLACAGLLLRSFQELGRVSPGFDPQHILTFSVSSSWGETADYKGAKQRVSRILDGLRSLPGVETAAVAFSLPGVPGQYQIELKTTEGRAETEPKIIAQARAVTPEYFAALRIPLVAGEMCRDEQVKTTAMVNRTFANTYFNGVDVIGRHLGQPDNLYAATAEVRGIVGDARETGLDRVPPPTLYWCSGALQPGAFFLVRTHGEPDAIASAVRRKLRELEPQRSVYGLTPLTSHISDGYAENRLRTVLLTFFAITAIALACVGLYGTLSYLVHVRQREIALRLALGAMRAQVIRLFLNQGLMVSALGCIAGLVLTAFFTRLLSGMLYGVSSTDAATLGGVAILVIVVSATASLLPSIRAARVEPMQSLREE